MTAAIRVNGLGKSYRIQHAGRRSSYGTLRESLVNMAKLPIRRLRGDFGNQSEEFWALKDISFEVKTGEILGIIGRNGAGKSTLLKILSRITKPTTGQVELLGRIASLLEVGTGFHPELTGRENVYLNGSILGMKRSEIDRKFDEIVAFAEIEKFLDTPVKRYSSGMYVRLAFAVAAHLESEILIIDEVLAVGDAEFQKKCLGKMRAVATDSGRTVLFVSHSMAAVQNLCSRAVLLVGGRVTADGTVNQVIEQYMTLSNSQRDSQIDLRKHEGRISTAIPFFTEAEIKTGGRVSNTPQMGDGIEIRLRYKSPRPLSGLRIGIIVKNMHNDPVVSFSTTFQDPESLNGAPDEGEIVCVIPSINLIESTYPITLISADNTGEIDWIENGATLQIQPNDVFGTGKIPNRSFGVIFLPAQWIASWRGEAVAIVNGLEESRR